MCELKRFVERILIQRQEGEVGMTDLRPCPFCGGEVSITYHSMDNVFSIWHKYDGCKFIEPMYIDGKYAKSLSDARNIWNKRSVPWWDEDELC